MVVSLKKNNTKRANPHPEKKTFFRCFAFSLDHGRLRSWTPVRSDLICIHGLVWNPTKFPFYNFLSFTMNSLTNCSRTAPKSLMRHIPMESFIFPFSLQREGVLMICRIHASESRWERIPCLPKRYSPHKIPITCFLLLFQGNWMAPVQQFRLRDTLRTNIA